MAIRLHVRPRKTVDINTFKNEYGPFSIALDGYVKGPPFVCVSKKIANFDHHDGVVRWATTSTAMQVYKSINMGLFRDLFNIEGTPEADVYINDPDQDTCLSYWLMMNSDVVAKHATPQINKLVNLQDMMDVSAGLYPLDPNTKTIRQINWVFQPYTDARKEIANMSEAYMRSVIEAVCNRISEYIFKNPEECNIQSSIEVIESGKKWHLIKETGINARSLLIQNGIQRFVSLIGGETGPWKYSIGLSSPFLQESLNRQYNLLNKIEAGYNKNNKSSTNRWGGADMIGGSPRETGSLIPPTEIIKILEQE